MSVSGMTYWYLMMVALKVYSLFLTFLFNFWSHIDFKQSGKTIITERMNILRKSKIHVVRNMVLYLMLTQRRHRYQFIFL